MIGIGIPSSQSKIGIVHLPKGVNQHDRRGTLSSERTTHASTEWFTPAHHCWCHAAAESA